jgi:hypothetical protein
MKPLLIATLSFLLTSIAVAEQKVEFGNYDLHYIVLNTTEIPADIAAQYDLNRSGKRAFINLSVLQKTDDGYGKPVPASIVAVQRSLLGQVVPIDLREIREGTAIYYIGDFQIINRETLWFDVELVLEDGTEFEFSFDQQVWQE